MLASRRIVRLIPVVCLLTACQGREPLAPGQGQLRVSLTMTGLDPDPNGGYVTVDSTTRVGVGLTGAVTLHLATGVHTVELGGLASNCVVDGEASREADVRKGDVTDVAFRVTCGAATGVVEVEVRTLGVDPDPDGYLASVDGGLSQRIHGGTVARFGPIPGGTHVLRLSDVADNCAVVGGNPVSDVEVNTGGPVRDTARVPVTVECVSRYGDLRVITTTTGPADPDGYVLVLDQLGQPSLSRHVSANDTILVTNLVVGSYGARLTDVAGNCAIPGWQPPVVTIASRDTATLRFAVECAPPAVLRVSAPTTGSNPDPAYLARVDRTAEFVLDPQSTLSLDLLPGDHSIALDDIAPNCVVGGANPRVVTLSAAAATDVVFPVICAPPGVTGLDITVVTSGNDPDPSYRLVICTEPQWDCFWPEYLAVVPGSATLQVDLPPGQYHGWLEDVAGNCRDTWAWDGSGIVTAGQRTAVRIDVRCLARVEFVATLTTTGTDRQTQIRVAADDPYYSGPDGAAYGAWLESGVPTTVSALEGVRTIGLQGIQENCRATSPNPVTVSLVPGVRTPVQFAVDCQPWPMVTVAVTSSGTNVPAGYLVGLDPDWDFGYAFSTPVTASGTVTVRLSLGEHAVWLDQVPANCTVTGNNPITLTSPGLGMTSDVVFAVACR
jgi:hypothetical protein